MPEFKFSLGQRVNTFDDKLCDMLVVARIEGLDGSLAYICSWSSFSSAALTRHTLAEYEIKAAVEKTSA